MADVKNTREAVMARTEEQRGEWWQKQGREKGPLKTAECDRTSGYFFSFSPPCPDVRTALVMASHCCWATPGT